MNAETAINVPLLQKVLDHITAHPQEHNQGLWGVRTSCGTAYCVAGHAVVMSGKSLRWEEPSDEFGYAIAEYTTERELVSEVAMDVLELEDLRDAEELFDPTNTIDDIWRIAYNLTGGEIQRPVTS